MPDITAGVPHLATRRLPRKLHNAGPRRRLLRLVRDTAPGPVGEGELT
jgi:hypothetical protein